MQSNAEHALCIYLCGGPQVWPGRFLTLVQGSWQACDIEWSRSYEVTPNAKYVLQPWDRRDEALLIPVWHVVLERHDVESGCWVARGAFTQDRDISVGWVLLKCSELEEKVEEIENDSLFEYFAVFPTLAFSPRYHFEVQERPRHLCWQ